MSEHQQGGDADPERTPERPSRAGRPAPRQPADATVPDSTDVDIRKLPASYQFVFVTMKFFGFPLIVASALGWWVYHTDQNARADRESDRAAFTSALDRNTDRLTELVNEIRRLEDGHR